jgi:hypothetical protein
MESASAFIDKKIKELGDWRGKTLAKVRGIKRSHSAPNRRKNLRKNLPPKEQS